MNAVEIAEAVSELAEQPFDAAEFPYAFLEAFGNKQATIKRLRAGATNKSDVGGVLQTNNVHIAVCSVGDASKKLAELKASPATTKAKAKFILATDGDFLEAEDIVTGETVACSFRDFPNHFGFFLALAGITTVQQIRESSFDIRATGRLNKLYVELLKDNPEWGRSDHRHEMNHFMARLIFCFFAEDTGIFQGDSLFTGTVERMSARDSANTHDVISKMFLAMNTKAEEREAARLPIWVSKFPYVNGGLFSGSAESPRFSRIARSYLLHIGSLDWKQINPDIFGSMIQAVADDEERGALGMHYTSVPNILKVLNPLFLDDLREKLEEAGNNPRSLLNLRKRMSRIRILDPACGSGNFLVIAYREMRAIEAEINKRRGEDVDKPSEIRLTNFRGIELRDFPAEIARLALIIAEYQCDVRYRGEKLALADFLPLDGENWITCGNALRLDWLSICPPTGTGVRLQADDLFNTPLDQAEIDFENEGGETYICGNPPYVGATFKVPSGASREVKDRLKKEEEGRKADMKLIFEGRVTTWKSLDYVAGWFMKASKYGENTNSAFAFVSTNSICQGQQVPALWPAIFGSGHKISFAHTSFKWANLAAKNAGVTVVIVGLSRLPPKRRYLYSMDRSGSTSAKEVEHINAYLVPTQHIVVSKSVKPENGLHDMSFGNKPVDGGGLLLTRDEARLLNLTREQSEKVVRRFLGSVDSINGRERFCLWLDKEDAEALSANQKIALRLDRVKQMRLESDKVQTQNLAKAPYVFGEVRQSGAELPVVIPLHSSENREYLPFVLGNKGDIVANSASALYDPPIWNLAIFTSRLHLVWIATVCGKIKTDYRYSNTLGWNTFPMPLLTEKNKADLTRSVEDILLVREAYFPATIADLYEPDDMPGDLREAHRRNDEVLERIYIGRRFKNDTERLEKLFDLYTKMTACSGSGKMRKADTKQ
jgi:hypothetical protein